MKAASILEKAKKAPLRWHWLAFGVACAVCYAFFAHPDVIETSNHSYLLLESIFSGRFGQFYNDVTAHNNTLYYINSAHYNIVVYIIFAVAELPVFIFNAIFGTAVNEPLLYFIGKLVSMGFFVGCTVLVGRIAAELKLGQANSRFAPLFFALSPPAFFSAVIMGQYDSICLFFLLLGLLYWLRGNMLRTSLWVGVGAACKFFPLIVFVPLVLLVEKRVLHIIKYGLISLWLVVPTSLLFIGRTGNMGVFNGLMMDRLFEAEFPAAGTAPIFPILYLLLCFGAYLYNPRQENVAKTGIWLCLAALCLFFFFVVWHPQWVILLIPFIVLTTLMEKNKIPWFWLDALLTAAFFLTCAFAYPRQLEGNLLDFGIIGLATGQITSYVENYNPIAFYYDLIPMVRRLPFILFGGFTIAQFVFKAQTPKGTPAARLAANATQTKEEYYPRVAWAIFAFGMAMWLLPTIFTWMKGFGYL